METDKGLGKSSGAVVDSGGGHTHFAWLPTKMRNGKWIWLATYHRRRSRFRE